MLEAIKKKLIRIKNFFKYGRLVKYDKKTLKKSSVKMSKKDLDLLHEIPFIYFNGMLTSDEQYCRLRKEHDAGVISEENEEVLYEIYERYVNLTKERLYSCGIAKATLKKKVITIYLESPGQFLGIRGKDAENFIRILRTDTYKNLYKPTVSLKTVRNLASESISSLEYLLDEDVYSPTDEEFEEIIEDAMNDD